MIAPPAANPVSTPAAAAVKPRRFYSPRPLIFIHIPKAAGTTLQEIVVRQFPGGRGFRFTGDTQQWNDFRALPPDERARFDVVHGHVHFGIHEYLPDPATYITMLRDPVDRVVSHYHYVMTNPGHYLYKKIAGGSFTLHDYAVTRASHELDNDQVRWLCSRHHFDVPVGQVSRQMVDEAKWNLENCFSVVGIMERFNESLECLRAAFGWRDVAPSSSRNVNKSRPRLNDIPPPTLDAIRQINRFDIELYDFAVGLFEEQLARLGVRTSSQGLTPAGGAA